VVGGRRTPAGKKKSLRALRERKPTTLERDLLSTCEELSTYAPLPGKEKRGKIVSGEKASPVLSAIALGRVAHRQPRSARKKCRARELRAQREKEWGTRALRKEREKRKAIVNALEKNEVEKGGITRTVLRGSSTRSPSKKKRAESTQAKAEGEKGRLPHGAGEGKKTPVSTLRRPTKAEFHTSQEDSFGLVGGKEKPFDRERKRKKKKGKSSTFSRGDEKR